MKGGCLCEAVQYEITGSIKDVYYCHCTDCQILSGSAYHVLGLVAAGAIDKSIGETTAYRGKTSSGFEMTREFCARCGTPLFVRSTRFVDVEMFLVSSLNDKSKITPTFQIWTDSRSPWSEIGAEIASYSRGADDN